MRRLQDYFIDDDKFIMKKLRDVSFLMRVMADSLEEGAPIHHKEYYATRIYYLMHFAVAWDLTAGAMQEKIYAQLAKSGGTELDASIKFNALLAPILDEMNERLLQAIEKEDD